MFEQFKILVESAEKNSDRRGNASKLYLSFLSGFLGTIAFILEKLELGAGMNNLVFPAIRILGMVMSLVWRANILSYKKLNNAKFQVINEMEEQLPAQPFRDEWNVLNANPAEHSVLTQIEGAVPIVFFVAFLLVLVYAVWSL